MTTTRCDSRFYVKVCRDHDGCEHVLALTADTPVVVSALDAAKRDLRWLLSEENDELLRLDWERMVGVIEAARATVPQAPESVRQPQSTNAS